MALLLHIDTATEYAGICLSNNSKMIAMAEHDHQKNHASFLQPALQKMMQEAGKTLQEIDAISVTGGPGSYTGIRVGMASAKGLCFALNKPLIVLNTLLVIVQAAIEEMMEKEPSLLTPKHLFYPMIDARRMEVFTSIYTLELIENTESSAQILDSSFFSSLPQNASIIFCGNGALKIPAEFLTQYMRITTSQHHVNHMITLSERAFEAGNFVNLAYSEPNYAKDFYNMQK